MIIQRKKRRVPGLNTTSTADISFMLLIFFLVTTSMDVDKGLSRELPPADKKEQKQAETHVEKGNLMALKITQDNKVLLNDNPVKAENLSDSLVALVRKAGKKHLVTLETDRNADYNIYFQVQDELMKGYHQVENISKPKIAESYANTSLDVNEINQEEK